VQRVVWYQGYLAFPGMMLRTENGNEVESWLSCRSIRGRRPLKRCVLLHDNALLMFTRCLSLKYHELMVIRGTVLVCETVQSKDKVWSASEWCREPGCITLAPQCRPQPETTDVDRHCIQSETQQLRRHRKVLSYFMALWLS